MPAGPRLPPPTLSSSLHQAASLRQVLVRPSLSCFAVLHPSLTPWSPSPRQAPSPPIAPMPPLLCFMSSGGPHRNLLASPRPGSASPARPPRFCMV
uniref:Uncharacterized protein n=1 Tax=Triticum urartu TaxID=4572 RepID=A0A8R7P4P3_TRIUA